MDITALVDMAKRIHDAERENLGASSTRDSRNVFWARVVGIAHHGHPWWNPTPDPQWYLKRAAGRPQSDDVVVSMPSRVAYDCILSSGADGYRFHADNIGLLPIDQVVYAPPVPAGVTAVAPPTPVAPPPPPAPVVPSAPVVDLEPLRRELAELREAIRVLAQTPAMCRCVPPPPPPYYSGRILGATVTLRPIA